MIRGYIIPELKAEKKSIVVDGNQTEQAWSETFPLFIGHTTETNVTSNVAYDDNNLFILSKVKDNRIINGTGNESSDGITLYFDPQNKSYEQPHTGVFSLSVTAGGFVVLKEGKNGSWQTLQNPGNIQLVSKPTTGGYLQELAVPWALIGGKPAPGTRMGINVRLTETSAANQPVINEDASGCNAAEPFSWLSLFLQ